MDKKRVVIWGAGRIGRGFIGDLFYNNNYAITLIDEAKPLVDALKENRSYRVVRAISADQIETIDIGEYEALHTQEKDAIQQAFNAASISALAVYPKDFEAVAKRLQKHLITRKDVNSSPMNILLCTNLMHAGPKFAEYLYAGLDTERKTALEKMTGIIETLVIRICPSPPAEAVKEHPLIVWTNGYSVLPVDKSGFKGEIPNIPEMRLVEDMRAEEIRKIYTYNMCHAVLSYHGHLAGHELLVECLADEKIKKEALGALEEVSQALQNTYHFNKKEMNEWIDGVLSHTNNPTIGDTVIRSAADPLRKLRHDDRLIGPALLCQASGVVPNHLIKAAAAAFLYQENSDEASKQLQLNIKNNGIEKTVMDVCGLRDDEKDLGDKIIGEFKMMQNEITWQEKAEKAYELGFKYEKDYHGCGQSVVAAATEALDIFDDEVFNSATGLCGGIGLDNQATCSSFTGGAMVIGMMFPRHRDQFGGDRENKYTNFRLVQALRERVIQEYGTSYCYGIHGKLYGRAFDLREKDEREAFEAAGGHGDHGCTEVVANISKWTVEIIGNEIIKQNNAGL